MSKDTGGSAFPCFENDERFNEATGQYEDHFLSVGGMTLRDYIAAQALKGLLSRDAGDSGGWSSAKDGIRKASKFSYEYADAMLAERKK